MSFRFSPLVVLTGPDSPSHGAVSVRPAVRTIFLLVFESTVCHFLLCQAENNTPISDKLDVRRGSIVRDGGHAAPKTERKHVVYSADSVAEV